MEIWLQVTVWVLLGLAGVAVLVAALRTRQPLRRLLGSGMQGLLSLTAVNLLSGWTQVSLGFSTLSVGVGFALGVPGVIGLLLMKILFPAV